MKKWMRNGIYILLVVLFAFSQIFNIFSNRGNLVKIGNQNITIRDVVDIGGRDESTFRSALQVLIYFAYIFNECNLLGLKLSDQDMQNYAKSILNDNKVFNQLNLDKEKLNPNGLQNIIKASLLKKQLFGLITFGISPSDEFIESLINGIKTSKSGYVGEFELGSIDQSTISKYQVEPNKNDLFKYLLSKLGRKYAQPKCYVVYLTSRDTYPSDEPLAELLENYKYTEHDCNYGTIIVDEIGMIDISSLNIDLDSYRTNLRQANNGQKYFIYYNPFVPDLDKIKNLWSNSKFAKIKAAQIICNEISEKINNLKTKDEKVEFVTKYDQYGLKFREIKDISLINNFQANKCADCASLKKKCGRCAINDCTCTNCFNTANSQLVSRVVAVNMLLNSGSASYVDNDRVGITIPIETSYANVEIDFSATKELIKLEKQEECQQCIMDAISHNGII